LTTVADVIVVGAGISGLATACELARRGAAVTVFEKDSVGFEASGRNMGAIGLLGKHAADIASASVPIWQRLVADRPQDFGYSNAGRLYVAHDHEDVRLIEEMAKRAADQDIYVELLSSKELAPRVPYIAKPMLGGAFSRVDALVEPRKVMARFEEMALSLGVQIRTATTVDGIDLVSGRARGVICGQEHFPGDAVVITGGVWSYALLRRVGIHIPYQIVELIHGFTEPRPRLLEMFLRGPDYGLRQLQSGSIRFTGGYRDPGVDHKLGIHDFRDLRAWAPRLWRHRAKVRLRVDPKMLARELRSAFGLASTAPSGFYPQVSMQSVKRRLKRIQDVIPSLVDTHVVEASGGLVDMTLDGLPVLGPVDRIPDLYLAVGFNGQGFGLGPAVGRLLSDLILGRSASILLERYRWSRFSEGSVPIPNHLI